MATNKQGKMVSCCLQSQPRSSIINVDINRLTRTLFAGRLRTYSQHELDCPVAGVPVND